MNNHGGGWSPHWCIECDLERLERVDRNLQELASPRKSPMPKKKPVAPTPTLPIEYPSVQDADKLKKIRAARRVVKKKELEFGRLTEERKIARQELDAAIADLCRLIDDSQQAEMFPGVDKDTGEVEDDD